MLKLFVRLLNLPGIVGTGVVGGGGTWKNKQTRVVII